MVRSSHTQNHMHQIVYVIRTQTGPFHSNLRVKDIDGEIWDTDWQHLSPPRDEAHEYNDPPSWQDKILSLPKGD